MKFKFIFLGSAVLFIIVTLASFWVLDTIIVKPTLKYFLHKGVKI